VLGYQLNRFVRHHDVMRVLGIDGLTLRQLHDRIISKWINDNCNHECPCLVANHVILLVSPRCPAKPCTTGQALPGISDEEAATIVHSELGLGLSQRRIQKLISKSRITDLRNGGQHSYVSARRLFWVIRELQAVANGESTRARHQ
jgi:hypothetical protein